MVYVWAILSAQAQTRTGMLAPGSGVAHGKFLALVEDAINSPVDIRSAINRYEEAMQHAHSKADFSFGEGLYLAPGDMLLRVGKMEGYNNKIIIATSAYHLGWNSGLNEDTAPPDAANDTGETGLVKPMGAVSLSETAAKPHQVPKSVAAAKADHEAHKEEKTALIVGIIAIGLGLLWFLG